ncbi:MAG: ATP-binding cassette domain-containing protein [Azospirillaceae bacterium]
MATVTYDRVTKRYPDGTLAVDALDLEIADGELVVFVGPSGCGKTTALRMLAGLEPITEGEIRVGDQVINGIEPSDRDIAMVFQNYALYPHMTVAGNMAFPLRMSGVGRAERERKVREVARTLGLERYLGRRPSQLSGGQRQRVAMGRALVREPQVFLMDEPLSNLDAKLRAQMRTELAEIQDQLRITTIYVTHDQVEAMTLGDRVMVLRHGVLQQEAAPEVLYDRPANLFVAGFIGSPPMNLVEARLEPGEGGGGPRLRLGDATLDLDEAEIARCPGLERWIGRPVVLGVRPEKLADAALLPAEPPAGRTATVEVVFREGLGSDVMVHFRLPGTGALAPGILALAHDVEDPAELEALPHDGDGVVFIGRFQPETRARAHDRLPVVFAPGAFVFFDPETGMRIGAG